MFWPSYFIKQRRSHNYAKYITHSVPHNSVYNIMYIGPCIIVIVEE